MFRKNKKKRDGDDLSEKESDLAFFSKNKSPPNHQQQQDKDEESDEETDDPEVESTFDGKKGKFVRKREKKSVQKPAGHQLTREELLQMKFTNPKEFWKHAKELKYESDDSEAPTSPKSPTEDPSTIYQNIEQRLKIVNLDQPPSPQPSSQRPKSPPPGPPRKFTADPLGDLEGDEKIQALYKKIQNTKSARTKSANVQKDSLPKFVSRKKSPPPPLTTENWTWREYREIQKQRLTTPVPVPIPLPLPQPPKTPVSIPVPISILKVPVPVPVPVPQPPKVHPNLAPPHFSKEKLLGGTSSDDDDDDDEESVHLQSNLKSPPKERAEIPSRSAEQRIPRREGEINQSKISTQNQARSSTSNRREDSKPKGKWPSPSLLKGQGSEAPKVDSHNEYEYSPSPRPLTMGSYVPFSDSSIKQTQTQPITQTQQEEQKVKSPRVPPREVMWSKSEPTLSGMKDQKMGHRGKLKEILKASASTSVAETRREMKASKAKSAPRSLGSRILRSLEKDKNVLGRLKDFGIGDQRRLLAKLTHEDTMASSLGGYLWEYFSPMLRTFLPANFYNRYRGQRGDADSFKAIDISRIGSKTDNYQKRMTDRKEGRNRFLFESLGRVSVDSAHNAYLHELADTQPLSIPITVSQDLLLVVVPAVRNMHNKCLHSNPFHKVTKAYHLRHLDLKEKLDAYNRLCHEAWFHSIEENLPDIYKGGSKPGGSERRRRILGAQRSTKKPHVRRVDPPGRSKPLRAPNKVINPKKTRMGGRSKAKINLEKMIAQQRKVEDQIQD